VRRAEKLSGSGFVALRHCASLIPLGFEILKHLHGLKAGAHLQRLLVLHE